MVTQDPGSCHLVIPSYARATQLSPAPPCSWPADQKEDGCGKGSPLLTVSHFHILPVGEKQSHGPTQMQEVDQYSGSQLGTVLTLTGHLAMSGDIFDFTTWERGSLLAPSWVEVKNAAKFPSMPRTNPTTKITHPKMSTVTKLRNLAQTKVRKFNVFDYRDHFLSLDQRNENPESSKILETPLGVFVPEGRELKGKDSCKDHPFITQMFCFVN